MIGAGNEVQFMELRVLNYFLMVAREENITRAARLLHMTQPTLSRQIAQLEEELGVKLFHRSSHNIVLTDDGMLLKRRAQELVSLAEKTRQEFSQEEQLSGTIAIGSGELKSVEFLSRAIASFHRRYPQVRFELFSGNSDDIKDRLEKGLLDMGLLLEPVDVGRYEFVRTNVKEEWSALVGEGSPLAKKERLTPRDFQDVPLILPNRELVRDHIDSWLGEYAKEDNIVLSGNLLYNMAVLARGGLGAVIAIKLDCSYDGLRYVPLEPEIQSDTLLVWKKDQPFSRAVEAFIRHTKDMLK